MEFRPLNAVGLVSGAGEEFLGTCFAFRHWDYFLTAAHCVGGREGDAVSVLCPGSPPRRRAVEIRRHPEADLAVVRLEEQTPNLVQPFWGAVGNYGVGQDFAAFGFPDDALGPDPLQPTPRLFKGHFQRFLDYGPPPLRYRAAELSVPSPRGLSGGPVFHARRPVELLGMATASVQSSTWPDVVETVEREGERVVTTHHHVVSYGVALILDRVGDWLDTYVPQVDRGVLLRG